MQGGKLAVALGVFALLALAARRAYAAPVETRSDAEILGVGLPEFPQGEILDTPSLNVAAFLYTIRRAEHAAGDVASGEDYRTFYGGSRFSDLSDHPVHTGEKQGVPLSPEMCRRAGYGPGCVSTAAGAYQMRVSTWDSLRSKMPYLTDFSPQSQDESAIRLLDEIGALRYIRAGEFHYAVSLASKRWASLPGSPYGQATRSDDEVFSYYNEAGGLLA